MRVRPDTGHLAHHGVQRVVEADVARDGDEAGGKRAIRRASGLSRRSTRAAREKYERGRTLDGEALEGLRVDLPCNLALADQCLHCFDRCAHRMVLQAAQHEHCA